MRAVEVMSGLGRAVAWVLAQLHARLVVPLVVWWEGWTDHAEESTKAFIREWFGLIGRALNGAGAWVLSVLDASYAETQRRAWQQQQAWQHWWREDRTSTLNALVANAVRPAGGGGTEGNGASSSSGGGGGAVRGPRATAADAAAGGDRAWPLTGILRRRRRSSGAGSVASIGSFGSAGFGWLSRLRPQQLQQQPPPPSGQQGGRRQRGSGSGSGSGSGGRESAGQRLAERAAAFDAAGRWGVHESLNRTGLLEDARLWLEVTVTRAFEGTRWLVRRVTLSVTPTALGRGGGGLRAVSDPALPPRRGTARPDHIQPPSPLQLRGNGSRSSSARAGKGLHSVGSGGGEGRHIRIGDMQPLAGGTSLSAKIVSRMASWERTSHGSSGGGGGSDDDGDGGSHGKRSSSGGGGGGALNSPRLGGKTLAQRLGLRSKSFAHGMDHLVTGTYPGRPLTKLRRTRSVGRFNHTPWAVPWDDGCGEDGEGESPAAQVIRMAGYPLETHTVVTEDGYVLKMERIPRPGAPDVALFMHGVLDTSLTWVSSGVTGSQAFAAWDQGFDVWLATSRSNPPRVATDPKCQGMGYWKYTINELGVYDVTAQIDRVHEVKLQELGGRDPRLDLRYTASDLPGTPLARRVGPFPAPHTASQEDDDPRGPQVVAATSGEALFSGAGVGTSPWDHRSGRAPAQAASAGRSALQRSASDVALRSGVLSHASSMAAANGAVPQGSVMGRSRGPWGFPWVGGGGHRSGTAPSGAAAASVRGGIKQWLLKRLSNASDAVAVANSGVVEAVSGPSATDKQQQPSPQPQQWRRQQQQGDDDEEEEDDSPRLRRASSASALPDAGSTPFATPDAQAAVDQVVSPRPVTGERPNKQPALYGPGSSAAAPSETAAQAAATGAVAAAGTVMAGVVVGTVAVAEAARAAAASLASALTGGPSGNGGSSTDGSSFGRSSSSGAGSFVDASGGPSDEGDMAGSVFASADESVGGPASSTADEDDVTRQHSGTSITAAAPPRPGQLSEGARTDATHGEEGNTDAPQTELPIGSDGGASAVSMESSGPPLRRAHSSQAVFTLARVPAPGGGGSSNGSGQQLSSGALQDLAAAATATTGSVAISAATAARLGQPLGSAGSSAELLAGTGIVPAPPNNRCRSVGGGERPFGVRRGVASPERMTSGGGAAGTSTAAAEGTHREPYNMRVVAHSLGGASLLIYLVMRLRNGLPHHVSRLILLTPAGFHVVVPWVFRPVIIIIPPVLRLLQLLLGRGAAAALYIPTTAARLLTFKFMLDFVRLPALGDLMRAFMRFSLNGDRSQWDRAVQMPHYNARSMPAVSLHQGAHFVQLYHSRRFQLFDYGSGPSNMAHYGHPSPPDIASEYWRINIPVDIVAGAHDGVIPPANVQRHVDAMRSQGVDVTYRSFEFGHMDFVLKSGDEVRYFVLNRLMKR